MVCLSFTIFPLVVMRERRLAIMIIVSVSFGVAIWSIPTLLLRRSVCKLLDGGLLANDTADLTVLTIAATVFLTALTTFLAAFLIHCGQ